MNTSKSSKARVTGRGKPATIPCSTNQATKPGQDPSQIGTSPSSAPIPDLCEAHTRAMKEIGRRTGIALFGEAAAGSATPGELLAGAILGGDHDAGPVGEALRAMHDEMELVLGAVRQIDQVGYLSPVLRGIQHRLEIVAELSDRLMTCALTMLAESEGARATDAAGLVAELRAWLDRVAALPLQTTAAPPAEGDARRAEYVATFNVIALAAIVRQAMAAYDTWSGPTPAGLRMSQGYAPGVYGPRGERGRAHLHLELAIDDGRETAEGRALVLAAQRKAHALFWHGLHRQDALVAERASAQAKRTREAVTPARRAEERRLLAEAKAAKAWIAKDDAKTRARLEKLGVSTAELAL